MKNFLVGFALAGVLFSGIFLIISRQNAVQGPEPAAKSQKYYCPMHPEYVSDKLGDCPICGMKLVPMEGSAPSDTAKQEESAATTGEGVVGYAPVKITPERLQMMGVNTEKARVMSLDQSIRAVGIVTVDETRISHIHTKFEGYIEKIFINYVGQQVTVGQPLFSMYSPELVATQKEYILALQARDQMQKSGTSARLPGIDLVEAARQRLSLWDITPDQIAQIEKDRKPIRDLTIYSPVNGIVTAKTAVQGNKVMPSDSLYDITDLSSVWVLADIYEINVPFVKIGNPATVSLSYDPARVFKGKVSFINPNVDEKSRTVKVRIVLDNPSGLLKPDMYADILLGGHLGHGVGVPESAVMGTGEREIVFIAKGDGLFEPREVKTGLRVRGFYEIKKGVKEGENVVTGANFLLDSESKLKAAIAGAGK